MKESLNGGLSCIFSRREVVGKTKIDPHRFGDNAKTVKSILGVSTHSN